MLQMRPAFRISFLIMICFIVVQYSFAQNKSTFNPELGNFFVKNYTRSMLNSTAGHWSLLQDRDGVIYIGNTSDGTIIYDGQRLSHVMTENGEIKKGLTRALVIDSKDIIYTSIGALQFGYIEKNEYGESIYHPLSEKLSPADEVKTVVWGIEIHNDTVFVQTEKIIYLYKDKKLLKTYHFQHIIHHIEALDDAVYLRVWEDGLYRFANGNIRRQSSFEKWDCPHDNGICRNDIF